MSKKQKLVSLLLVITALILGSVWSYSGFAEESKTDHEMNEIASDSRGEDAGSQEDDAIEFQSTSVTTVTKTGLENDDYALFIDEATGNIRIVNKQSNKEWLGAPQADETTLPNNVQFMNSPVHIQYTNGASVSQTYTLKEPSNVVTIEPQEDSLRATFDVKEINVSFALEYRLNDGGLSVTIPQDSIKEAGDVKIISLEVLPFFNAGKESDEGALFLPDGSGALMTFKEEHPLYLSGYSQPIYGPDPTFSTTLGEVFADGLTQMAPPKMNIALPVFGSYRNGTGFLGIVTHGEEQAHINGTPAGIRNIPLYRASVEFLYRKQDVIFIGSSGKIPLFQGQQIDGDRSVQYVLLEDAEANYIGMAKAYRNYLIHAQGVEPSVHEGYALRVNLVGGLQREEIIGTTFIEMTTFDQARSIIEAYADKGIDQIEVTIEGWSKDGLYGNQPEHFPVEKHLGGSRDLERLIAFAKERDVALHLQTNYIRAYEESHGMSESSDAVRGLDREVVEHSNMYVSSRFSNDQELFYLLKPRKAYEEHMSAEMKEFKKLGVTGVHLDYVGNLLYSDQDTEAPMTRHQAVEVWTKALDAFHQRVGDTSVDYGFAYTLGHVDEIRNIPMDSSGFIYMDETVPFYQIAIHGLVPYTAGPSNLRNDATAEFLRAIEYGALPSYRLTYEETSELQRTMANSLFSSSYKDWIDQSVEEYQLLASLHEQTFNQLIVQHEKLSDDVYKTTYENGVYTIVNYNEESTTIDGTTVGGHDYIVSKGEIK
ncbi:DUF5696 domain-containing protein [Aureibacillus halotolerans]|uniref:Glycosyl hydrolase family 101 n=1 Tax=Aureibacillus halotolerans TaxID=1508390 RepID=A0A4R6UD55_9BACI|nr:DUF5696 domain-containing protein [Aureibacillus halotolerans]TDQ41034.1 hypothetical protein EV213_10431 [Aureibacillus halotolerans]